MFFNNQRENISEIPIFSKNLEKNEKNTCKTEMNVVLYPMYEIVR